MASVGELLQLAQFKRQQNMENNPLHALAQGIGGGIQNSILQQQKQRNLQEQAETFQKLFQASQQTTPKTDLASTQKVLGDESVQKNRGVTDISRVIPTRSVSFDDSGNIKTKIGFRNPTPQEIKSRFDLQQEQDKLSRSRRKDQVLDSFIEGDIDRQELVNQSQDLGITLQDIREAMERRSIGEVGESGGGQEQASGTIIPSRSQSSTPDNEDFVVTKIDPITGIPLEMKRKEKSAAQKERDVENRELSSQARVATNLFVKARKEIENIPNIGERGLPGRIAGFAAKANALIGESPALRVFEENIGKFATLEAKASGEQRPTDEDIKRFIAPLLGVVGNDEENAIKIETQLDLLSSKGVNIDWAKPLVREFENITGQKIDFSFGSSSNITREQAIQELKRRGFNING